MAPRNSAEEPHQEPVVVDPPEAVASVAAEVPSPAESVLAQPSRPGSGSRRRKRQAFAVVAIALLSAGVGVVVGSRLQSPADAASSRKAPTASLITVPVERRALSSSLVIAGDIQYVEPITVRLGGSVGASAGERQVITRIADVDSEVVEGGVLLEVSGRPVFAFHGDLPMYRQLVPGSKGPDVLQLETALNDLGFTPGTVDDVYDQGTEAALDLFYASKGYASEGPSESQRNDLTTARRAVTEADTAARRARVDLAAGGSTVTASERLQAQQAVNRARDAVPEAQAQAKRDNDQAAADVTTATQLRNNAKAARDADKVIYDAAAAPGAVNPATGGPYTAPELAALQQPLLEKEQALLEAEQALSKAIGDQTATTQRGVASVKAAQDALDLAVTQLSDLDKPRDTRALQDAVKAADAQLAAAQSALQSLEATVGTVVPPGEVVFLPNLPTTLTAVLATVGTTPPTDIAQVSSTATQVSGRVSKADAALVKIGADVTLELRDVGVETTGVITDIRKPKAAPTDPNGGGGTTDSDRLEVVVEPADRDLINQYIGFSVRITAQVSSTSGAVLAVPVSALSVGPDGTSRVEVERQPAIGNRAAKTEMVEVTVGLAAQGYAEIIPVGEASLVEGDRVIVGTDAGTRRSRRRTSTTEPASTQPPTSAVSGG